MCKLIWKRVRDVLLFLYSTGDGRFALGMAAGLFILSLVGLVVLGDVIGFLSEMAFIYFMLGHNYYEQQHFSLKKELEAVKELNKI